MQCMLQNILKEVIFWALLASGDFHNNEVQRPRKALLADAWSEILAGLSELGLTVLTSLWRRLDFAYYDGVDGVTSAHRGTASKT